jgi:hypothetical protein
MRFPGHPEKISTVGAGFLEDSSGIITHLLLKQAYSKTLQTNTLNAELY